MQLLDVVHDGWKSADLRRLPWLKPLCRSIAASPSCDAVCAEVRRGTEWGMQAAVVTRDPRAAGLLREALLAPHSLCLEARIWGLARLTTRESVDVLAQELL